MEKHIETGEEMPVQKKTLRNQRVLKEKGRFSTLRKLALVTAGVSSLAVLTGKFIADEINESRIRNGFEDAVIKHAEDSDGDYKISDRERAEFLNEILRSAGMSYEDGTLRYSDGKKADLSDLRHAVESYNPSLE